MSIPIRSSEEITLIINKGNNAIADIGYDIIGDAKRGVQISDPDFKDKVYRLILLRSYLKNLVQQDGTLKLYYQSSTNEKKLNYLLDAVNQLSKGFSGSGVPLIRGKRVPLIISPSNPLALLPAGGISGQYLKKLSSQDYDFNWSSITDKLALTGGTMSGSIDMGNQKITNLAAGSTNGDAVRYQQLTLKADIAQGSWTRITGYINGWVENIPCYYRINQFGMVSLRGQLAAALASSRFILPAASLPLPINSEAQAFMVPTFEDPAGAHPASRNLVILGDGSVNLDISYFTGDVLALNNIHYWTA